MLARAFIAVAMMGISTAGWSACSSVQLMTAEAIGERLTPPGVGIVRVAAQSAVAPAGGLGGPEQIYKTYCFVCHDSGVAGAPKLGDDAAWSPRVATGIDTLVEHVTKGYNAMPPMGTCSACSEADLKATVDYMIGASD